MPPRFDEVRRLADLEKIAKLDPSSNYWEMFKYKMATSPWLLEVARCFRRGDADEIAYAMDVLVSDSRYTGDPRVLTRLLRAAKIMEEK